jgi:hypothetical protein
MLTNTNKVAFLHVAVSEQECTIIPKYFHDEQKAEFKLTVLEVKG